MAQGFPDSAKLRPRVSKPSTRQTEVVCMAWADSARPTFFSLALHAIACRHDTLNLAWPAKHVYTPPCFNYHLFTCVTMVKKHKNTHKPCVGGYWSLPVQSSSITNHYRPCSAIIKKHLLSLTIINHWPSLAALPIPSKVHAISNHQS